MDESSHIEAPDPNPVWGRPDSSPADPSPGAMPGRSEPAYGAAEPRPADPGYGAAVPPAGPVYDPRMPGPVGPASSSSFGVAPVPVVAIAPRKSGSTLINVVLGLALAVAVGGVAFAAGRLTAPASAASGTGNGFGNGPRASGAPGNFRGAGGFGAGFAGGTLRGTVTGVTSTGITLTVGQTTIEIPTDASTTYHTQAPATTADVTVGSTVLVELNQAAGQGGAGGGSAGATPAPGASARTFNLGPATDVTVVAK